MWPTRLRDRCQVLVRGWLDHRHAALRWNHCGPRRSVRGRRLPVGLFDLAISHGDISCAYLTGAAAKPPDPGVPKTGAYPPPVYPLVAGGFASLVHIGSSIPFPSEASFGHHCADALPASYHWGIRTRALTPTLRLGFISWLVLMAGVIALLRSCDRGRRWWEPATLIVLACFPRCGPASETCSIPRTCLQWD